MVNGVKRMSEGDNKRGGSKAPISKRGSEWDNLQEGLPLYQVQGVFSGVPESDRDYTRRLKEYIKKLWVEGDKLQEKLKAVKSAFTIHYSTLHDCAWMDSKKMLKVLDETAEEVKNLLEDQSSGETADKVEK